MGRGPLQLGTGAECSRSLRIRVNSGPLAYDNLLLGVRPSCAPRLMMTKPNEMNPIRWRPPSRNEAKSPTCRPDAKRTQSADRSSGGRRNEPNRPREANPIANAKRTQSGVAPVPTNKTKPMTVPRRRRETKPITNAGRGRVVRLGPAPKRSQRGRAIRRARDNVRPTREIRDDAAWIPGAASCQPLGGNAIVQRCCASRSSRSK
jgi:hypothetical protein